MALGDAPPALPRDPNFEPSYRLERIEVRGNAKTKTALILREVGLAAGDVVSAADPRVELARLRLLALGFFLDVHLSLSKGHDRGSAILTVEVEERGTIVLDAIYLGSSDATTLWGGLAATERNLLGRGLAVGAGFVGSTRPKVVDAESGFAGALRISGPPAFFSGRLALQGSLNVSRGSEFFRTDGPNSSASPADFVAADVRRLGGTLGAGRALTRTLFVIGEVRYESLRAGLPERTQRLLPDGEATPIDFQIRDGFSHLSSFAVTLDLDTRIDPVLPHSGHHVSLSIEGASQSIASDYAFLKGVAQSSSYLPTRRGQALGFHVFLGGIWGNAPFFDRFFVGDLNQLLPPRALGLNFSTQPSRNLLGTHIAGHRYDNLAGRLLIDYAIPIWRRHGLFYRGDAFAAVGLFALANPDDLRDRTVRFSQAVAADLTFDLGVRLDTPIGIFTLSIANAIGRIPF